MDADFWKQRWVEGQIGFHRDEVHPDLLAYGEDLTDGAGVLVPLCGKSLDLLWLAERVPTVGVELSEIAVRQLFTEHGLKPEIESFGPITRYRSGQLVVLQGDLFEVTTEHLPFPVDRCWDRAALVALDPARRPRYAARLPALLRAPWRILLNAFTYDPDVMDGPPHSVPEVEVRALYAPAVVDVLDERDELTERFAQRGHTWWRTQVYRIEHAP